MAVYKFLQAIKTFKENRALCTSLFINKTDDKKEKKIL